MLTAAARVLLADFLDNDRTLTPTERRVFCALADNFGDWIPKLIVLRLVYPNWHDRGLEQCDVYTLRTHMYRVRRKLAHTRWRIENRPFYGLYRLVEVRRD